MIDDDGVAATLGCRFAVPDHVVFRELAEETVLLNLESGAYYGLDAVAGVVFGVLSTGAPAADAVDAVLADWQIDRASVERDLAALLQQLLERGLVERVEEPRAT